MSKLMIPIESDCELLRLILDRGERMQWDFSCDEGFQLDLLPRLEAMIERIAKAEAQE